MTTPTPESNLPPLSEHASKLSAQVVGEGTLILPRRERASSRCGCVFLAEDDGTSDVFISLSLTFEGQKGSLIAVVTSARENFDSIGAAFGGEHDYVAARVGEKFVLGAGEVFYERGAIGLKPSDSREYDWLDADVIRKLHKQEVRLFFQQDTEATFRASSF